MEILILSACGLVANQYMKSRAHAVNAEEVVGLVGAATTVPTDDASAASSAAASAPVGAHHPRSLAPPPPAPTPLGLPLKFQPQKTDSDASDTGYDDARYNEQYIHPQDPNPNVSEKPWMRMANAPYKPKEEIVSETPGPQDVFGRNMNSRVTQIEADFAASTVPVTSEKQFDRPVEQIATGNGSAVGFHIGAGRRYHRFILNDQAAIESDGGPRGAFSGASGPHVKGDYRTVTQRSSLHHESFGPPTAVGVPQSSAPVPSFEITPAHLEMYTLDAHMAKGARAPVQASASTDSVSFRGAHDENLEVLHTSLVTGGERFATGASGYREAQLHVPRNNDPLATYDQRVVPNFKIARASDYTGQEVVARQMAIPEMSQNVSALRKDRRPPVSGSTKTKKSSLSIQTDAVTSGAGAKSSSNHRAAVDPESFRAPSDRKVDVAEKAALVSVGAAASRTAGSGSSSSHSLFRTTQSMSELVGTPFIRGAGGKHARNLEPVHEETDAHLAEMESSGIRQGMNRVSTTADHPPPSLDPGPGDQTQERGDVFKKSERTPLLVAPGKHGTTRTGAANIDAAGILVSRRGLEDDSVNVVRAGTANNARVSTRRTKNETSSTKNRKLGDVLKSRMQPSTEMKRLLSNPYSLPAASRLTGSSL